MVVLALGLRFADGATGRMDEAKDVREKGRAI
jgi:hypothetical protein